MFKLSCYNSLYVPYERPGMATIPENGALVVVLDYFANFLYVFFLCEL
jgi:hypothetical protein